MKEEQKLIEPFKQMILEENKKYIQVKYVCKIEQVLNKMGMMILEIYIEYYNYSDENI